MHGITMMSQHHINYRTRGLAFYGVHAVRYEDIQYRYYYYIHEVMYDIRTRDPDKKQQKWFEAGQISASAASAAEAPPTKPFHSICPPTSEGTTNA